jgi:glycosyltransferase involved in cell wall biosynthesis
MNNSADVLSIVTIALGALIELLYLYTGIGWRRKKYLASISMLMTAFGSGILVVEKFGLISLVFAFICIYRIINNLRIVENRMNNEHLKKVTKRTFVIIASIQLFVLIIIFSKLRIDIYNEMAYVYAFTALIVSTVLLSNTIIWIKKSSIGRIKNYDPDVLPTITLAIPARNEDYDLKTCLEAAVNSDYPKLEIIVIDDCSQDKTPKIIKEFAHNGVRFVQSSETEKSWLAKNKAYQTLYEQASGQLILFMGVDVLLSTNTITKLVEIFLSKKAKMMSVIPSRKKIGFLASIVQPMRYWRELAIPKIIKQRPPVLSTCWLINRHALADIGEFKSVARAIVPEEHIAMAFGKDYLFKRSNNLIGLTTHKDFFSQWQTAIRTHYPNNHKRPESVLIATLAMVVYLIAPYIILILTIIQTNRNYFYVTLLAISCIFLTASNSIINIMSNKSAFWLSLINFPFVAIVDVAAMQSSMYIYEFKEVIWRGRNITAPAMHVYSHLPKF